MNKILQHINEVANNEAILEGQVVILSRKIQEVIGLKEIPQKLDFTTGHTNLLRKAGVFQAAGSMY